MEKLKPTAKKIFANEAMERAIGFELPWANIGVFAAPKPTGGERTNEDSLGFKSFDKDGGILVVSDGLGGHSHGDKASKITVENICKAKRFQSGGKDMTAGEVISCVANAKADITRLSRETGATLIAATVDGENLQFFTIGDSMGMLVNRLGRLLHKTVEHSVVGYGLESGLLDAGEAKHHSQSHVILNAVGDGRVHVDVTLPLRLAKGNTVVLASDGLTGNLSSDEITDITRKGTAVEKAQRLSEMCLSRMSATFGVPDDLSILVADIL